MSKAMSRCSAAVVALAIGQAAHAQVLATQAATPGGLQLQSGLVGPVTSTSNYSETYPIAGDPTGAASATGQSLGYGSLRASASVEQLGGWTTYQGFRASGDAAMNDDLLVSPSNPFLLGTPGVLSVTVNVTGSLIASFSGPNWTESFGDVPTAAGGIGVYVDSAFLTYTNDYITAGGGAGPQTHSLSVNRTETINIPFIYGQFFNVNISLSVIAGIESYSPQPQVAGAYAAANDWRFTWGGVTGVGSDNGPLGSGEYQLTSLSGTDYSSAIPTPGAASVLCVMGLSAVRRRRR